MADMTEFSNHQAIEWNGHVGQVQYGGGDRSMVVMFYRKGIHDAAKSVEHGRPYYVDKTFVRIHPPGERLNIIDREASPQDSHRFAQQWAQFQQQKQQVPEGTPIDMLYPEVPSVAAMLRAHGVQTIEMCSELSAHAIENIGMGAQRYVNDSVSYLKASEKGVKATQFRADMAKKDQEIKLLSQQVNDLQQQIQQLIDGNLARGAAATDRIVAQHMTRPVHMPATAFDPQNAQINAHGSALRGPGAKPQRKRQRVSL